MKMVHCPINLVRKRLESFIAFLEPWLPLSNCHMVEFFTGSVYETHVPSELRNELEANGLQNSITSIFDSDFSTLPLLTKYIEDTKQHTLKNCSDICFDSATFSSLLNSWIGKDVSGLKLDRFMTSKKSHEVEVLSAIATGVNYIGRTSHLVDIGDGKGYLSSLLAYHHNLKVLGIDASKINTEGAVKRATKLSKVWKGLVGTSGTVNDNNQRLNLYKQVTQFVDDNVDFVKLIENVFLEKASRLGLVGLHTCGDLGPTSVKIFSKNECIKTVCNVSCCYHLLTEKFEADEDCNVNCGFPMSKFLTERRFKIGKRARMTGAQSVDRILNKKELPSINIFYRAVLQVILEENCDKLPEKQVGRIKKCSDFLDYTRQALNILECDLKLSDEDINSYYAKYSLQIDELNIFYLIRCMLSPIVETIILVDRLLYLLEKGYTNTFLVRLFDPVISPRCYGLISMKDDNFNSN